MTEGINRRVNNIHEKHRQGNITSKLAWDKHDGEVEASRLRYHGNICIRSDNVQQTPQASEILWSKWLGLTHYKTERTEVSYNTLHTFRQCTANTTINRVKF